MIIEFLLGFSVPLVARKLIKIFPEEAGTTLAYLLTPKITKVNRNSLHLKKWSELFLKLLCLCLFYGFVTVGVIHFFDNSSWIIAFVWILLVLLEIDRRVLLLPDVLTVPLLIIGFVYACVGNDITPQESSIGALFGYFLPAIVSCMVAFIKKNTIGGGDVKILAALGAWLGIYYLSLSIVISCIIFGIIAIAKQNKVGPYGPAIVVSSIIAMYIRQYDLLSGYLDFLN